MRVSSSLGPLLAQNNIPAGGALINDVTLTHIAPNSPLLIIGKCTFIGMSAGETISLYIERNGVSLGESGAQHQDTGASTPITLVCNATVPAGVAGDVYRLRAYASASTADIPANYAALFITQSP